MRDERAKNNPPFKIGVVDYLNAYPLWGALEFHSTVTLVPGTPSFLAEELAQGRVDAACISSIEYWRHRNLFTYHPHLCVAAEQETQSIRVFARRTEKSFVDTARSLRVLYTTTASRSSVAQLKTVLAEIEARPLLQEVDDADQRIDWLKEGEALLAIGDVALRHRAKPSYDLQREYFQLFRRGFVYALWVYRPERASELEPLFTEAYARYKKSTPTYLEKAAQRFGFPLDFTRIYLTETIRHEMTEERQKDMEFFFERVD